MRLPQSSPFPFMRAKGPSTSQPWAERGTSAALVARDAGLTPTFNIHPAQPLASFAIPQNSSGCNNTPMGHNRSPAMPQSPARVVLHIVFSTKNRTPFLKDEQLRLKLHAYMAGILQNFGCEPVVINGVEDHVHVLCNFSRTGRRSFLALPWAGLSMGLWPAGRRG